MIDRKTIREAFATLLTSALTAAQVVYDHQPGDFGGQSPAVTVGSGGSSRPPMTFQGNQTTVYLDVDVFVLTSESAGGSYTQADAEDALDQVETQLAGVIAADANQENGTWNTLDYADRSQTEFVIVDGKEYKRERIPIAIGIFS